MLVGRLLDSCATHLDLAASQKELKERSAQLLECKKQLEQSDSRCLSLMKIVVYSLTHYSLTHSLALLFDFDHHHCVLCAHCVACVTCTCLLYSVVD